MIWTDKPLYALDTPLHAYTERDMLDLLHQRYAQMSQGQLQRFVCAEHVRNGCGFGDWDYLRNERRGLRIADFIAQDTWEAQGLLLHGHEVKVSRSDWLHELAQPDKAEAIKRFCDRWWLVVPDARIVRDDLPDGWGLLALDSSGRLRVKRRAPHLTPDPMPATFRASLMRAVAKTAGRLP
jgi:hypothetical protein